MLSREEFKKKLKDVGWTQAALARAVGRTPPWLNKIIVGTRGMNQKYIEKISNLTGISPNDLLGWMGKESPPAEDDEIIKNAVQELPLNYLKKIVKLGQERIKEESKK